MTAAATRPHIAALSALLTGAGLTVLPGGEGTPAPPCVVLWPTPGQVTPGSIGAPDSDLLVEITTVACGDTSDQAMWVADKITATLSLAQPTIAGRNVLPAILASSTPVSRDDSLAAPIYATALRWRLLTTPA